MVVLILFYAIQLQKNVTFSWEIGLLMNQVQRAMNLFFGSVLATISLTVPTVTIIATLTGQQLIFGLEPPHMVVMSAVLILCHISFSTGRTNVLNGAAHLALFAGYLLTIML